MVGFWDVGLFEADWGRGARNLATFSGDLFPPETDADLLATLGRGVLETLEMAFLGTRLGAAGALPLAVLAARPLSAGVVAGAVRVFLAVVRTIPSLLWAVVFVVLFGLGPLAGTFGIAVYTLGYLGKLFAESIEGVSPEVVEAVRATGASRVQLARHAVLPEVANSLVSQGVFMFEYNVRASSIVGFVGAGGIGFYLVRYLELLEYGKLATALLVLLAVVLAVEYGGTKFRRRYLPDVMTAPA
ncbi:MAG: phosphonate ABC transporter, permease protein PhnE [Methanobacteriota archaeon]